MGERRLFVALVPDAALQDAVAGPVRAALAERLDAPGDALKLVPTDKVHLTLLFLGAVAEERVEPLAAALAAELDGARAPRLALGAAGAFPQRARERVLWVGLGEERAGELAALRARVVAAAARAGLDAADPQPLAPHLTVARVRARGRRPPRPPIPDAFWTLPFDGRWTPDAVHLVESTPGGGGRRAQYVSLARFPLVG